MASRYGSEDVDILCCLFIHLVLLRSDFFKRVHRKRSNRRGPLWNIHRFFNVYTDGIQHLHDVSNPISCSHPVVYIQLHPVYHFRDHCIVSLWETVTCHFLIILSQISRGRSLFITGTPFILV